MTAATRLALRAPGSTPHRPGRPHVCAPWEPWGSWQPDGQGGEEYVENDARARRRAVVLAQLAAGLLPDETAVLLALFPDMRLPVQAAS